MSREGRRGLASRRLGLVMIAAAMALLAIGSIPRATSGPKSLPPLRIDPNTARVGLLEALPRIGPTLARRIVEAREQAPFAGPDDLDRRVRGIGPATLTALRPFLRFDPDGDRAPEPRRPHARVPARRPL